MTLASWVVTSWLLRALVADAQGLSAVEVKGPTTCPAPGAVEAALAGLVGPKDPAGASDVAELRDDGAQVIVSLNRASGEAVGEKPLGGELSCAERAQAAAVVIAAWEARLGTDAGALTLETAARSPPTPTVVAARADHEDPGRGRLPPPDVLLIEPGAALQASWNGAAVAPAATIEVTLSRPRRPLVLRLAGLVVGTHATDVGPGRGTWRRFGLAGSLGLRRSGSAAWIEGRAGVALTVLDIEGSSFPQNGGGITFDPGGLLGFRVGLRTRSVSPFVEATVAVWPRGQAIYVGGAAESTNLPRAEAMLGAGIAYGGGR